MGRDVPAILLSGDLPSMMRVVKTPIPQCHFLSKPVDTKALLSAIAELEGELGASAARSASVGSASTVHVDADMSAEYLPRMAAEWHADIVVMGAIARSGLRQCPDRQYGGWS